MSGFICPAALFFFLKKSRWQLSDIKFVANQMFHKLIPPIFYCWSSCPRHALNSDHCLLQGHTHAPETRGLCLSEEQTITTVCTMSTSRSFILLLIHQVIHHQFLELVQGSTYLKLKLQGSCNAVLPSTSLDLMVLSWFQLQVLGPHADGYGGYPLHHNTEIRKLTRHCEVTAILVLYGLPRWVIIHCTHTLASVLTYISPKSEY